MMANLITKNWQKLSKMKGLLLLVLKSRPEDLGEVAVSVLLSILPLQVFLLYQDVNALLDHWDLWLEPGF